MFYNGDPVTLMTNLVTEYGQEAIEEVIGAYFKGLESDDPKYVLGPLPAARAPHYLAYVRQLNCCSCGQAPRVDPHHDGPRGMGQKTDDYRTIPLCFKCHRRLHDGGELPIDIKAKMIDTLVRYLRLTEHT